MGCFILIIFSKIAILYNNTTKTSPTNLEWKINFVKTLYCCDKMDNQLITVQSLEADFGWNLIWLCKENAFLFELLLWSHETEKKRITMMVISKRLRSHDMWVKLFFENYIQPSLSTYLSIYRDNYYIRVKVYKSIKNLWENFVG